MGQWQSPLENLEMKAFNGIYNNETVLLTGHTGFKGSWLSLWLKALGANITGIALEPISNPSHWNLLDLNLNDKRIDIRNEENLKQIVNHIKPSVVFHLAAQSLVRHSYLEPLDTWSTNVMGTANLLEACRQQPSVKAIIVVTTDKCYENKEWVWGYRETDQLGGYDPYSASKASTELLVESYRKVFFSEPNSAKVATVRAGNVIGGGDWAKYRLIPDIVNSIVNNEILNIRFPLATRPWQHVLESLSGYLLLAQKMLEGQKSFDQAWNFGPQQNANLTVLEVLSKIKKDWSSLRWEEKSSPKYHESSLLYLDSSKAHKFLNWKSVWSVDESIQETISWYKSFINKGNISSMSQLQRYVQKAKSLGIEWSIS